MVKLFNVSEIQAQPMLDGVEMRMVIGPAQGAPHFNMRIFDVEPGFATPFHSHWWEHEVFVLSGSGVVKDQKGEHPITQGSAILVPGGESHQFINTGEGALRFMCLVPQEWLESQTAEADSENIGCMG